MDPESHPGGGPPIEIWEGFCGAPEHQVNDDSALLQDFAACSSPFYFASELVASPLHTVDLDTADYDAFEVAFQKASYTEEVSNPDLRKLMYDCLGKLKGWDQEAAADNEPVKHTKELLAYLGATETPRTILLAHRARRLAYGLISFNFPRFGTAVSEYFMKSMPLDVDRAEFARYARAEVYAEPTGKRKLDACLPLLCDTATELELMKFVTAITFFQIQTWSEYDAEQRRQQAVLHALEVQLGFYG